MAGAPTEAELQTQWRNAVAILESLRAHVDTNIANDGGLIDTLNQSLEGEITPTALANAAASFRAGLSALVTPGVAASFISPILQEYASLIAADVTDGFGAGYTSIPDLMTALYEYFHRNSLTVQSRGIAFDGSATTGTSNQGNGSMARLTTDANGYPLEFATVERKTFRCRADRNSGVPEHAESFEMLGADASFDALLRSTHGSGDGTRTFIQNKNAGSGAGGSLLTNSSFSRFDPSQVNAGEQQFAGWDRLDGAANLFAQDTTNYYRTAPGDTTTASLQLTGGSGTVRVGQTLASMRVSQLDPDTPYFLRVMANADVGSAVGGSLLIRMGGVQQSVAISSLSGWTELAIPAGVNSWFRTFNEPDLTVEIQWASSTSGTLLIDDVIFAPWDLIDGTYWFLRASSSTPTSWAVDDTLAFTDTGGAPTTGIIQWWLYVSGLGYLPSTGGTPTFTDPT